MRIVNWTDTQRKTRDHGELVAVIFDRAELRRTGDPDAATVAKVWAKFPKDGASTLRVVVWTNYKVHHVITPESPWHTLRAFCGPVVVHVSMSVDPGAKNPITVGQLRHAALGSQFSAFADALDDVCPACLAALGGIELDWADAAALLAEGS